MKNSLKTLVIVLILSIFSMTTFASNSSGEEDLATFSNPGAAPGDPGETPINDYLIPMLVLGIAIGYSLLRKKTEIVD
jgi:hypothetical protein